MKALFLDDDERRQMMMKSALPCVKQTWTADETIEAIKAADRIDWLFLDHDLGGKIYVGSNAHDTGMTVAKWLARNQQDIGTIVIHTFNPAGAKNMGNELKGKYSVRVCPFLSKLFTDLAVFHEEP